MHIALAANARMPTEWAHGVQIAHMAEAFARLGHEVELLVPDRPESRGQDVAAWYGLSDCFRVRRLPDLGAVHGRPLGQLPQRLSYIGAALALLATRPPDLLLSRDEVMAALARPRTLSLYELHKLPSRRLRAWAACARTASGVVSTNGWKRDLLVQQYGLDEGRILVAPNGTDVERFQAAAAIPLGSRLGIARGARLILYAGHLHAWKGVEHLVAAAPLLPESVHIVVLGGRDEDLARFRAAHAGPRVHLPGPVPPAEVAGWLKAADLLVLPNIGTDPESTYQTSPLKLFEYMAAGRPILASDLPSVREILDERCAWLVEPGSPAAIARAALAALADPEEAARRAAAASVRVEGRSWSARAHAILDFAAGLRESRRRRCCRRSRRSRPGARRSHSE